MDTRAEPGYAARWRTEGTSGEKTVTEAEWTNCTDPIPMLEFLTEQVSERKLRLFGVACCRRLWHLLDKKHCKKLVEVGLPLGCENLLDLPLNSCRKAIELAERAADEAVSAEELRALSEAAIAFQFPAEYYCACYDDGWGPFDGELVASGEAAFAAHNASLPYVSPESVVWNTAQAAGFLRTKEFGAANESGITAERNCHCDILRDIFGNPFSPLPPKRGKRQWKEKLRTWLAWNDGTVQKIAQAIYDERAFDRMPVFADALEEAGCHDLDILNHCRQPGEHVRGCWVVDLLLWKE